jgi:general secretion pathway protein A
VILVGQPQLNAILDQPDLEQLTQRVKLRYHIRALSEPELGQYIHYRLSTAGAADRTLFLPGTVPVIYKYAGGTPRLINILCDAALTCAYADSLPKITVEAVEAAAGELQWPSYSERAEQRRQKLAPIAVPSAVDSGLHEVLREQSRSLAIIAAQLGKLDDLSPMLASIKMNLAAIETTLRDFVQSQAGEPQSGPAASRRKSSG